jgi:hypothetical protein
MFHVIKAWLARLLRQILEIRLERDNALAAAYGWHAWQVKPGTWSYRDPRFIYRIFDHTCESAGCPWCDSKVAEWFYYSADLVPTECAVQAGR